MTDRARTSIFALILGLGVFGVMRTQPGLAESARNVKVREDVTLLPPPEELRVMTLGYHAAAADLVWTKLLVEYGTHWSERRPFHDIARYIDALLALEADYAALYRYVDTLLVFRPPRGTLEDVRMARAYLERGVKKERPNDPRVWLQYGQFMAFLGPSFLTADAEKDEWRREGANAMARAVELGADAQRAVSAATILNKTGERNAAIRALERAYSLTDDPAVRQDLAKKLAALDATAQQEEAEKLHQAMDQERIKFFPFLRSNEYLVFGPSPDAPACAGFAGYSGGDRRECARRWADRSPPPQTGILPE